VIESPYGVIRMMVLFCEIQNGRYIDDRFLVDFHHEFGVLAFVVHPVQPRHYFQRTIVVGRFRHVRPNYVVVFTVLQYQVLNGVQAVWFTHEKHHAYIAIGAEVVPEPRVPHCVSLKLVLRFRIHQDQNLRFQCLWPAMAHVRAECFCVMMEMF